MKKLLFLLLITPIISFAQLKNGRYFIKLMHNGKNIQTNSNSLMLADGCADFTCRNQYFDIAAVSGSSTLFTIKSTQTGKFLTFSDLDAYETTSPTVTLETLKQVASRRYQQFLIVSDKDGMYSIHPNKTTKPKEVFLATELRDINNGGTQVHLEYKTPDRNPANYNNSTNVKWTFITIPSPTISRTPVATPVVADRTVRSEPVVVAPRSDNKLEIDFRTGADNLETRSFQTNPKIIIDIKNRSSVILEDINKGQTWPNNSIKRVTIPLPADVTVEDLQAITIHRTVVSNWNNLDAGMADNWNIDKLTVTAITKVDGRLTRTILFNQSGRPLVRIVYEQRNSNHPIENTFKKFELSPNTSATPATVPTTANASIVAIFGTGGDDLRGGQDNVNLTIRFKSGRNPITLNNFNAGRKWPNFSERTLQKLLPNSTDIDINDIGEIVLRHTGGGGISADNWYLDKFKLTIQKGSETKVLIDRVEAPIHFFTGDTRSKTLRVSP